MFIAEKTAQNAGIAKHILLIDHTTDKKISSGTTKSIGVVGHGLQLCTFWALFSFS